MPRVYNAAMETYLVGGAVRDELLGLPVGDRDWVVVGATQADMERAGFKAVGRDFPVFLHPQTGEEYALARTERKTAPGYRGFVVNASPDVTLEEDLQRRDLTINAMARAADGTLIDPWGGRADLEAHDDGAFLEKDVGDLAPLQVDDVLLLVEFGIQQVAILMVTDALVILGRVECLA